MIKQRGSGILMHITSLPSPFGIGDLGPEAYRFVDYLKEAGQKYWQVLPLNPTRHEMGNSPYSGPSAFAGNTLLISPELLYKSGCLKNRDIEHETSFDDREVQFPKVIKYKKKLFHKAFEQLWHNGEVVNDFLDFCERESWWLDDYALFAVLKDNFHRQSWTEWPEHLRDRDTKALEHARLEFSGTIEQEKFLQFMFFKQWHELKGYCHKQGVHLIGDLPFYVNHESADVWTFPHFFKLDEHKRPSHLSGVPPDYFSKKGQLWGTPVFDWDNLSEEGFSWWVRRIEQNLSMVDLLRLDHFRAFSAFWEVPSKFRTARQGKWIETPGFDIFRIIEKEFPGMPFIAEDLGEIDEPVRELMEAFCLPGMRLLIYAFNREMGEHNFLPHNHSRNSVVYTGTHDNITARGWFEEQATAQEKKYLSEYAGGKVTVDNVHKVLIRLGMMSPARLAVFPMQDVLGLGKDAIMNRPASPTGNWTWRLGNELWNGKNKNPGKKNSRKSHAKPLIKAQEFLMELVEVYER